MAVESCEQPPSNQQLSEDNVFCDIHCSTCILSSCIQRTQTCQPSNCPRYCGMRMHACKLRDHIKHICPRGQIRCLNRINGCTAQVERQQMWKHLIVCPASVIVCPMLCDTPRPNYPAPNVKYVQSVRASSSSPFQPSLSPAPPLNQNNFKEATFMPENKTHTDNAATSRKEKPLPTPLLDTIGEFVDEPLSQILSVRNRHMCGQLVPRDNFRAHCQFHSDVLNQIEGSIELKCPLSVLGCDFLALSRCPNDPKCRIRYNPTLDRFLLLYANDDGTNQSIMPPPNGNEPDRQGIGFNSLTGDLLLYLSKFLDDTTLLCLSLVSRHVYDGLQSSISGRSVISPQWSRLIDPAAKSSRWVLEGFCKFIPGRTESIEKWYMLEARTAITKHLVTCRYFCRQERIQPFTYALPP